MSGPWEKFSADDAGPWSKFAPSEPATPSEGESALRGGVQGASFGLRDEAAGFLESPLGGIKKAASYLGYDTKGDKDVEAYLRERDESRALDESAKKANPKSYLAGEVAGGVIVPGVGVIKGASTAAKIAKAGAVGAGYGLGSSKSDSLSGLAKDTALGAGVGSVGYGVADKALAPVAKSAGNKFGALLEKLGGGLKSKAEKLAETATGATRSQAEKFAPGAGRELLDRGLVKFGDAPKNIAKRANSMQDAADNEIQAVLSELDASGVKASTDDVLTNLQRRIDDLRADPSSAPQAKALEAIKEDVSLAMRNEAQPLSAIEQWKRGFGKNKRINWADPANSIANKEAYGAMRETTEGLATAANPELASKFMDAKKTHGLLEPIIDASEKRTLQLQQHPILGLNDMAAGAAGGAAGDPTFGLATATMRRAIAPRAASSGAVTLDKLGSALSKAPQVGGQLEQAVQKSAAPVSALNTPFESFKNVASEPMPNDEGIAVREKRTQNTHQEILPKVAGTKYERTLNEAMQRGEHSFASTYYLMSKQDPEFRQLMEGK